MSMLSRDVVLDEIRNVAKLLGTDVLSKSQFHKNSKITISNILKYFPNWSDACKAAGISHDSSRDPKGDEELLTDFGRVVREIGHVPAMTEYLLVGKHGSNAFNRFGFWGDVAFKFCSHFEGSEDWSDVCAIIQEDSNRSKWTKTSIDPTTKQRVIAPRFHAKRERRPTYGDPIDFRGLRHEPVNELGVVFLFGMVARELGYLVEAVQASFPDCEAKRKVSQGQWQPVSVEFEYASRNFADHNHDPNNCDVIVCWIHNWKDCPERLDIVELSEVIKRL